MQYEVTIFTKCVYIKTVEAAHEDEAEWKARESFGDDDIVDCEIYAVDVIELVDTSHGI